MSSTNSFMTKEDIVVSILAKFDTLMSREEYIQCQQRIYKLNKAFSSIVNSQNVSVSIFSTDVEMTSPKKIKLQSEILEFENLKKLEKLLDDLLLEKSQNQYNTLTSLSQCVTTSSSEDEKAMLKFNSNLCNSKAKKHLLKNLFSYEILLKTYLFESSLTTNEFSKLGPEEIYGKNLSYLSNNTLNLDHMKSKNIFDTPLSKSNFPQSFKSASAFQTPQIKKSFFQDKEIKINLAKRRRSLRETEYKSKLNLDFLQSDRRSSDIIFFEAGTRIETLNLNFSSENPEEANQVTNFTTETQSKRKNSIGLMSFKISSQTESERKGSIFRDRDNYLTNIIEKEEMLCSENSNSDSYSYSDSDVENSN